MRVTKQDFVDLVNELSTVCGVPLYIVPVSMYMYISPVNDTIEAQRDFLVQLSNSYSRENYYLLLAYYKGFTHDKFAK